MAYFCITLVRSAIGLPKRTRGVLEGLGLHRRMQTVYHPVRPDIAGMIFKVKELVQVQEVARPLSKSDIKSLRKPEPGYWIESRASASAPPPFLPPSSSPSSPFTSPSTSSSIPSQTSSSTSSQPPLAPSSA